MNMINMRSRVFLITMFILLVSVACNPVQEVSRSVKPLDEANSIPGDAVVYSLPRTVIRIDVEYEKIVGKRGPFYDFRFKYLGLDEGIEEDFTTWNLSNITLSSRQEIDPEQYYIASGLNSSGLFHLSERGLVLSVETGDFAPGINDIEPYFEDRVFFPDNSVKRNIQEYSDTASKIVFVDTAFIRVPYVEMKSRFKTLNEKAEEAANFIIKIRKRRFKLLSGQYDVFPEGDALEYAVNELNRLEKEYLSLFIGKTVRYSYSKSFELIPEPGKDKQLFHLFGFSEESGVLAAGSMGALPVNVDIQSLNTTAMPGVYQARSDSLAGGDLIYRVPEVAKITVLKDDDMLFSQKLLIYQLGSLIRLPGSFYFKEDE